METIYPRYVKNEEELSTALNDCRTVIIVTDSSIIPEIKKHIKEIDKQSRLYKKISKIGGLGIAAGTVGAIFAPTLALIFAASAVTTAGIAAVGVAGTHTLKETLFNRLKNYRYTTTSDQSGLVLIKYKGINSFDEKNNEIEFC